MEFKYFKNLFSVILFDKLSVFQAVPIDQPLIWLSPSNYPLDRNVWIKFSWVWRFPQACWGFLSKQPSCSGLGKSYFRRCRLQSRGAKPRWLPLPRTRDADCSKFVVFLAELRAKLFFLSFQLYMKAGSGNGKKRWGGFRLILLRSFHLFILIFVSDLFTFVGLTRCRAQNNAGRLHFSFPLRKKLFPLSFFFVFT